MHTDVPNLTQHAWMMTQPQSQKTSMEYCMLICKLKEAVNGLAICQAALIPDAATHQAAHKV